MGSEPTREWLLERYLLEELPAAARRKLDCQPGCEKALEAELEALSLSNREILRDYPAQEIVPKIKERLAEEQRASRSADNIRKKTLFRLVYLPAAASLLVLTGLFWLNLQKSDKAMLSQDREIMETRIKGDNSVDLKAPSLHVYRKSTRGVEELADGSRASEKDIIQLACSPADNNYGVIVSLDGQGSVTLHFPATTQSSTMLPSKEFNLLENAFELDDAPEFERFILLLSDREIPVVQVLAKARELAADPSLARQAKIDLPYRQLSKLILKSD